MVYRLPSVLCSTIYKLSIKRLLQYVKNILKLKIVDKAQREYSPWALYFSLVFMSDEFEHFGTSFPLLGTLLFLFLSESFE